MLNMISAIALITIFCLSALAQDAASSQDRPGTHVVLPGETLYSVSKEFYTKVDDLLRMNPDIIDYNLPVGKLLRVPEITQKSDRDDMPENALLHQAMKKETLYSISKKNNTDVASLMRWNHLNDPVIQEGQWLIVGYKNQETEISGPLNRETAGNATNSTKSVASSHEENTKKPSILDSSSASKEVTSPAIDSVAAAFSSMEVVEKGIATWVSSETDNGNFYALHATAAIGTEMMVKNLMNGKIVTVKVIGKVPATSINEKVLIKISASAAKTLGVLDEKFLVELAYNDSTQDKEKLDPR